VGKSCNARGRTEPCAARRGPNCGVSAWADWAPKCAAPNAAANGRRYTRIAASMFLDVALLRDLYLETGAAVMTAATGTESSQLVLTQGHTLSAAISC
jgi:hypothetical protein